MLEMRRVAWWWLALGSAAVAWGNRAEEIARIHVEAIGGRERVMALQALRMTGWVATETRRVPVTLVAARPARLWMEMALEERRVVQAWDGLARPWRWEEGGRVRELSAEAAERFLVDAEFDDALVAAERLEFAGEREMGGKKLLRVLVVRKLTENVFVLVDPQTYFIVLRVQELMAGGRRVAWMTRYEDHRPVNGVLLPHAVTAFEGDRMVQRVVFERVEGNPPLAEGMFAMPRAEAAAAEAARK